MVCKAELKSLIFHKIIEIHAASDESDESDESDSEEEFDEPYKPDENKSDGKFGLYFFMYKHQEFLLDPLLIYLTRC